MCPVRATLEIGREIHSYNIEEGKISETPVNYVEIAGKGYKVPSSLILSRIRLAVASLGEAVLGFTENDAGTHSNRSGGAMGMFFTGTPVYTIMLMGRWSLDAFMRYIRKQVLSLSHGISAKMLTFEQFYTVPDFVHTATDGNLRLHNNTNLAATTNLNG
jgi:hypothetical protein